VPVFEGLSFKNDARQINHCIAIGLEIGLEMAKIAKSHF